MAQILQFNWQAIVAKQNQEASMSALEFPDLMDIADKHDEIIEPLVSAWGRVCPTS